MTEKKIEIKEGEAFNEEIDTENDPEFKAALQLELDKEVVATVLKELFRGVIERDPNISYRNARKLSEKLFFKSYNKGKWRDVIKTIELTR